MILSYGIATPRIGQGVLIAPTATVVGDVDLADGVSVWFGAVLRGDVGSIRVGARSNLQDLVCVHVTGGRADGPEQANTLVGCDVTVGHRAVLHGCTVGDGCLVGVGSIVLDLAVIGAGSVVAAGAVVPPGMHVPPRSVVRGVPARIVGETTDAQARLGRDGAEQYFNLARRYRSMLAPDLGPE